MQTSEVACKLSRLACCMHKDQRWQPENCHSNQLWADSNRLGPEARMQPAQLPDSPFASSPTAKHAFASYFAMMSQADATAAGQSVSTEPTTTDAVEAAPAGAPEAEAAGAPETAAAPEAEPAPVANGDASTEAAEAPRQSGFDVQPTAEQAAAQAADGGPDEAAVQAAQAQAAATASALTQTAGALEQMVQVPGSMVGKLIGKQGETIKGLQYSTNTRIQVLFQAPAGHTELLEVAVVR